MIFNTFLKLELKNFLSGRAVLLSFLCILLAGAYGTFHGVNVIEKQREVIAQLPALEAEHTERLLSYKKGADLADVLYYLTYSTADEPSSWSPISIGQRDVNPYNVKVRMLALEGQIYDSELTNPTNLLFGNFDLSFVIVFLFPLLIIAFTHNLISSEQETGTWSLLHSQPVSVLKIVSLRLVLRFALVFAAALLILILGCLSLGAEFDQRFFAAALLTFAYVAFWFGVAAFVISFGRGSTFNALTLLGTWIFLVLLAPALLSSIVSTVFPVSESMETSVEQREGYHEKWDKPKAETMQRFYQKYPEYKDFPIPEDRFSWGWYYAMQQTGDEDSADAAGRYREKLEQRNDFTQRASWFLPSVAAQLQFNEIAQTDLENHLSYLDSVRNYHEVIRKTFYPYIFRNTKVADFDLKTAPRHSFKNESRTNPFSGGFLATLTAAILFIGLGWWNLQKRISSF
ncbi:MAG: DUF3526 domain-containing protein [Acidobacteriota bacterium]|nr:DUF3526 domain-containing protein [Acidobacteriota bacterium]